MQKITTYLWFETQAEEAAELYTSLFADSKIVSVQRNGAGGPGPEGSVLVVTFELAGQVFIALNGGPHDTFNDSISLYVECADQAEVDDLWARLLADGGRESQCGWLKDRFGVSWQIIPKALPDLLGDPDPGRSQRAMRAMFTMRKIDIQALKNAADQSG